MRRYGILIAALLLIPAFAVAGGALGQQNAPREFKITLLTDGEVVGVLTLPNSSTDKFDIRGDQFVFHAAKQDSEKRYSISGNVSIRIQRGSKTLLNVTTEQAIMEIPEKAPMPQMKTNQ